MREEESEKFITGVDSDVVRSTESGNARASMSGMNNCKFSTLFFCVRTLTDIQDSEGNRI